MNRLLLAVILICHTGLVTAPTAYSHGSERHFGTSLNDRPTFKSSPAFLEMVIGVSFSRSISHIETAPEKLASDLTQLVRYAAALATSQPESPEFEAFSKLTQEQAELIRDASRKGRKAPAIDGIRTLQGEFERLRPKIKKKEPTEK